MKPNPNASGIREHYETRLPGLPELRYAGRVDFYRGRGYTLPSHAHSCLEIVYFRRGKVHWWAGGEKYEISGNQAYVTWPGEKHGGINDVQEPCQFYWLGLDLPKARGAGWLGLRGHEAESLVREMKKAGRVMPAPGRLQENMVRILAALKSGHGAFKTAVLKAQLLDLLITLVHSAKTGRIASRSEMVKEAIRLMEAHLHQRLGLRELARRLGWSPTYVKTRFREETGVPPAEYYLRLRVNEAGARLAKTGQPVTTIAMDLGFSSSQAFSMAFRRLMGLSPSQYRQRALTP